MSEPISTFGSEVASNALAIKNNFRPSMAARPLSQAWARHGRHSGDRTVANRRQDVVDCCHAWQGRRPFIAMRLRFIAQRFLEGRLPSVFWLDNPRITNRGQPQLG